MAWGRTTQSLTCSPSTAGGTTVRPGTASAAQGWKPLPQLRSSSRSTVRTWEQTQFHTADEDDEDVLNSSVSPRPPSEHLHLDEPGPCRVGKPCELELLQRCQPSCSKLHLVQEDRPGRLRWAAGGLGTGAVYFLHGGVPVWALPLPGQEPAGGDELDRGAAGHGGRGGAGFVSGAVWDNNLGKM